MRRSETGSETERNEKRRGETERVTGCGREWQGEKRSADGWDRVVHPERDV